MIEFINAELIRQYLYCNRIPYFRRNFKITKQTYLMKKGTEYHIKKEQYTKDNYIYNNYFENYEQKFGGRVDLVILYNEYFEAVEFKRYLPMYLSISHLYQVIVGGLAAEYVLKLPLKYVSIQGYNGKKQTIPLDNNLKEKSMHIIDEVRKSLYNLPPPTENERKCDECEFFKVCERI